MQKVNRIHLLIPGRRLGAWLAFSLCLLLVTSPGWSAEKAKAPPPPAAKTAAPAPDARLILQKMCDFLKSQPQFTYKAEVVDDEVYEGGKKLQYGVDMETFVRRPDRLRVNAVGDLVDKQFYFDGKAITLCDKNHNVYGVLAVSPDIESALAKANKEFGVRVALTDLASPKLGEVLNQRIKDAVYVGLHKVRGGALPPPGL